MKGYQTRATEKGLKVKKQRDEESVRMDENTPAASSNSSSSSAAPASSPNDSGGAARMGKSGEGRGSNEEGEKRKAEGEHSKDPERFDGKWMRVERNKRKTEEEQ